jgi:hypothetical protein
MAEKKCAFSERMSITDIFGPGRHVLELGVERKAG